MTQQSPEPNERLSGTLLGGARNLLDSLQDLSAPFAIAGFIGLVVGIVFWALIPDLRFFAYLLLAIGAGLLIISMTISFRSVGRAASSRSGRYGVNTVIMIAAFLGIAGLVNFLAFENLERIDVTATKQFELAPRTERLLADLGEPVEARAFFGEPNDINEANVQGQVEEMLREFEAQTGSFSYEFIDPDREPEVAREYDLESYGNIVFTSLVSKRNHQVSPSCRIEQGIGVEQLRCPLEQNFVTALLIVTAEEKKQVYFLSGHDEKSIFNREEGSAEGFATASANVERENYGVSTLNLSLNSDRETFQALIDGEIVGMLVVAGPQRDLRDNERDLLDRYLQQGGNVMFLLDPNTPQTFRDFLARWGVELGSGQIIDRKGTVSGTENVLRLTQGSYFPNYLQGIPDPAILQVIQDVVEIGNLSDTVRIGSSLPLTVYPGATNLTPAESVVIVPDYLFGEENPVLESRETPTAFGVALAITSSDTILVDADGNPMSADDDILYPAIAMRAFAPADEELSEGFVPGSPASLVVFGDSDFASNSHFNTALNSDIFLNSINWLLGDTPLVGIRAKPITSRDLILDRNQYNLMRYLGWFLLPSVMALAGALVWWRRR